MFGALAGDDHTRDGTFVDRHRDDRAEDDWLCAEIGKRLSAKAFGEGDNMDDLHIPIVAVASTKRKFRLTIV